MATDIAIKVHVIWEQEAGDCEPCPACGDNKYLFQYRMILVVAGKHTPQTFILCQSCIDFVEK